MGPAKTASSGAVDGAAQPPSLADQHPFHDFPAHWQQRAAHRALPYFAHTHFTFHDPQTGTLLHWSNRDQRKGRYPIVAEHYALGREGVVRPRFRLWAWEWFDVSWHAAFWFLLGSCVWVCNGFLLIIPVFTGRQDDPYTETLTTAAAWLALAGGILFEIGSVFLILDALNSKRNAELGKERSVGGHLHAVILGRKHLSPWLRPALRKRNIAVRLLDHAADAAVGAAAGVTAAAAGAASVVAGAVGTATGGSSKSAGQNGAGRFENHGIGGPGRTHTGDAPSQALSNGYANGGDSRLAGPGTGQDGGGQCQTLRQSGSSRGGSSSGDVRVDVDSLYAGAEHPGKPGGAHGGTGVDSTSGSSGGSTWCKEESVPEWRWFGWEGRDIGFMASFLQLCGATIFLISVITGAPKVLPPETEANQGLWDGVFWTPQVVGSMFFILSSYLYMVETQRKWWLPRPQTLGWHVGFWNLIGAVGFWLSGFFGYWGPPDLKYMDYGVLLCTWWGSCSFLIGSYAQLVECINKHPA